MLKITSLPLYVKLTLLFTLLCMMSTMGIAMLSVWSHEQYHNEVSQQLNAGLATYIIEHQKDELIQNDQTVNQRALQSIAMNVMMINPMVEVYLLDKQGDILGHALHSNDVLLKKVSLKPIQQLLTHTGGGPVYGDDPRDLSKQKIFSVSEITTQGQQQGFLYIVLASNQLDTIGQKLSSSYIAKISFGAMLGMSLIGIITALFGFWLLTKPLRQLTNKAQEFFQSDTYQLPHTLKSASSPRNTPNSAVDELKMLETTFDAMTHRIEDQFTHIKQADYLRRELISNISHDLRTPLASIEGYIETLLIKAKQLSTEQQEKYLNTALRHSRQLSNLVSQLFELSKLDANGVKPQKEAFPLLELIYDVVQTYQLKAATGQITLSVNHNESDNPIVTADLGLLERVFQNLLENSIRYTPKGGAIEISVYNDLHDQLKVAVRDTGKGIPAHELPYVFERYFHGQQQQNTVTNLNKRQSTGLGLAIVKRILDLHESQISVVSEVNKGTQFEFALPQ